MFPASWRPVEVLNRSNLSQVAGRERLWGFLSLAQAIFVLPANTHTYKSSPVRAGVSPAEEEAQRHFQLREKKT